MIALHFFSPQLHNESKWLALCLTIFDSHTEMAVAGLKFHLQNDKEKIITIWLQII